VYLAKIVVTLRRSILDPQGKAVHHAISSLGMPSVQEVRIGKYIEMKIEDDSPENARRVAEEACRKLLSNPVMEDYTLTLEKL
jgi:phosphoribosylformylglycinamidine synthase PurS subunit